MCYLLWSWEGDVHGVEKDLVERLLHGGVEGGARGGCGAGGGVGARAEVQRLAVPRLQPRPALVLQPPSLELPLLILDLKLQVTLNAFKHSIHDVFKIKTPKIYHLIDFIAHCNSIHSAASSSGAYSQLEKSQYKLHKYF